MGHGIDRPVPDFGARRVHAKKVVALPVPRRSDRSRNEPTAAVRTHVTERFDARRAERAFIRTNASIDGTGRQRLVAVLAGRTKFQHRAPSLSCSPTARADAAYAEPQRSCVPSLRHADISIEPLRESRLRLDGVAQTGEVVITVPNRMILEHELARDRRVRIQRGWSR